jgi:hypothetical protein
MKSSIKEIDDFYEKIFPPLKENDEFSLYKKLNLLGYYYTEHLGDENANEIMTIIEAAYMQKDLFLRNAVENEFLSVLAQQFKPSDLNEQLRTLPESLWTVYIKIVLETFKTNKL